MIPTCLSTAARLPPVHPYAAQYPLLTPPELEQLGADIAAHRQRVPIVLLASVIIDGRNRWLACALAGVVPVTREFDPEREGAVEDYIDSVNLHRRHLTPQQRALAGARILERLAAGGKARKAANLRHGEAAPEGDKLTPSGKSIDRAASMSGSSAGSIKAAVKVLKNGVPELVEAVKAGTIAVSAAAVLACAAPEEQRAALGTGSGGIDVAVQRLLADRDAGRPTAASGQQHPSAATPPLTLTLFELPPTSPARLRRRLSLRRVLGATLAMSADEQRALCEEILERLDGDEAGWL